MMLLPRRWAAYSLQTTFFLLSFLVQASLTAGAERLNAVVVLDTTSPEAERIFTVLQSHTADLAVDLQAERSTALTADLRALNRYFKTAAQTYQADIVFFADFSDSDQVVLYVSMPKLGTTLIRNIDAQNENVESRIEITAVVIRGILAAMMSGAEIGVHVSATAPAFTKEMTQGSIDRPSDLSKSIEPQDRTKKADPKTDKRTWGGARAAVQAAYGIGFVSGQTPPVPHFQALIRLSIKSMGIFFSYRGTFPFGKEDEVLSLVLTPHPLEIGFWSGFRKKNVFFRLGAALLLDPLSVKATPKTEYAAAEADFVDLRFAVSPQVAIDWYLTPEAYVTIAVCADFFIFQNAYYVEQAGTPAEQEGDSTVFLRLWPVSPMVQLGIGFGFAK